MTDTKCADSDRTEGGGSNIRGAGKEDIAIRIYWGKNIYLQ